MQELSRIQKLILYIKENYSQDIDKEVIEQIAHCPYRNIQGVFKKLFKETIPSFKKKLKLENAYKELVFSQKEINKIAHDAGYTNLQSFSRAFTLNFKKSPREARKQKEEIHPSSILNQAIQFEPPSQIYMPKIQVWFKGIKTNYNNDEIAKLWDTMDVDVENTKQAYYGLIIDQPLISIKTKCRFEACVHAPKAKSDLESKTLFGRKYLKYTYRGSYDLLDDYYRLMYQDFLFKRSIQLDNSPIIEHYEMNDMNEQNEEAFVTYIYVPVK